MSDDKDKKGESASKGADIAQSRWEYLRRFMIESRKDFFGSLMILAFGLTSFHPKLRHLAGTLLRVGWGGIEEYADQLREGFQEALQALQAGLLLLLAFACVAMLFAATNANMAIRACWIGPIMLIMPILSYWSYGKGIGSMLHLGALLGVGKSSELSSMKWDGAPSIFGGLLGGAKSAVEGAGSLTWTIGKKFGWAVMWMEIGGLVLIIVPFHHLPFLLWLEVICCLALITLHALSETQQFRNIRDAVNKIVLVLMFVFGIVAYNPIIASVLLMDQLSPYNAPIRFVVTVLALWLVLWAVITSNKAEEKRLQAAQSGITTISAVVTGNGIMPSESKKGFSISGAASMATLLLVAALAFALPVWLFCFSEHGTHFKGVISEVQAGRSLIPEDWRRAVKNAGTASASTVTRQVVVTEEVCKPEVTYQVNLTVGQGILRDPAHLIKVQEGDVVCFKILKGDYTIIGEPASINGCWNGKLANPADFSRSLKMNNNIDANFINESHDFGALYYRIGSKNELIKEGVAATCTSSGEMVFLMNIPQNKVLAESFKGQLVLEVTVKHPQ